MYLHSKKNRYSTKPLLRNLHKIREMKKGCLSNIRNHSGSIRNLEGFRLNPKEFVSILNGFVFLIPNLFSSHES